MPSKLRKALGAVKDQTSISLAKVSNNNSSNLEVLILKATRHDEVPIDERYVQELLGLISSNKLYAAACAQAIAKRVGKTRNWMVAVKSLMLVLRIFQDGDPFFPREVLHAMKRGAKILNLSTFRDDSNSNPWDYTAFVRTFALYLDERLDCFLTGKLQRRFTNRAREPMLPRTRRGNDSVIDMKPVMLIDKISHWQRLLDRAVATRPTGAAKTNRLVQISLYAIVQESFDLYRDVSDGLTLLLDSFFHLPYQSCVNAFQTCVKASKQFEELSSFYDLCKSIGVGRTSEYPSVQKISEELIEILQEFLKDQTSFPASRRSPSRFLLPGPTAKEDSFSFDKGEDYEQSDTADRPSEKGSEFGSRCTSLEDLMSTTDVGTSPPAMDLFFEQFERFRTTENGASLAHSLSLTSLPCDQGTASGGNSTLDLVSLDDWPSEEPKEEQERGQTTLAMNPTLNQAEPWELVLTVSTNQPMEASPSSRANAVQQTNDYLFVHDSPAVASGFQPPVASNLFDPITSLQEQYYNPFLQDAIDAPADVIPTENQSVFPSNNLFPMTPTFQATPTFNAQNPNQTLQWHNEDNPFGPCPTGLVSAHGCNSSVDQQHLLREQQLWLQQQDKIIAKICHDLGTKEAYL
ncbi:hypothetical protein K2173_018843 [Erythroxylum novogranatense]|uniref:ENTH domain-containing protein n=1 Tax=Erythroxylum novogranatense TaxID=1862640 RepID=A0AAV8SBK2_9ROSI|nr:hypothetical protein K2173_018843 [Erythroxylum novogranatense]